MRIAYLTHFYPPTHTGGVEVYTAALAEKASRAGMEVGVLCADRWGQGAHYFNGSEDEASGGVFVRRLFVNWLKAPRPLDWLYDSPVLGAKTRLFLRDYCPDVVHVSSCYALSARSVFAAVEMGLPIVMHLHDYWTICARHTLLHKNNEMCSGPESTWKCQRCLLTGARISSVLDRFLSEPGQKCLYQAMARVPWLTRQRGLRGMLGDLQRRRETVLRAAEAAAIRIVPTHFAREILCRFGVKRDDTIVMNYGLQLDWVKDVHRNPASQLRVGFLGNVIPIKGVHLLVEAYSRLCAEGKSLRLEIWGDTNTAPEYYRALRLDSPSEIVWGGRYGRTDLGRIFSNLDIVVVPSIWYETQGIVIQEAFAAGLPVIVSDGTSMAETVTHGQNGLHFRMGSVDDLAAQIRLILDAPQLLERLRSAIPAVRSLDDDMRQLSTIYEQLLPN